MDQNSTAVPTSSPMDICNCRVRRNVAGIMVCNVKEPSAKSCQHAVPVMNDQYCNHPHVMLIEALGNLWWPDLSLPFHLTILSHGESIASPWLPTSPAKG